MKGLVGHEEALRKLPDPLPQVVLLLGPAGVGKSLCADLLTADVAPLDLQRLYKVSKEDALKVLSHHATAPLSSSHRVTVADVTSASPEALNVLLKLSEEPPEFSRLIFYSDGTAPATLRSRCFTVHLSLLEDAEVYEILESKGVPEHVLVEAVVYGQGSVSRALDYSSQYASRKAVEAVLLAVWEHDPSKARALLSDTMKAAKGEVYIETQARREVVADLFRKSLRASLTSPEGHALSGIHPEKRLAATRVLESRARAHIRALAALTVLLEV